MVGDDGMATALRRRGDRNLLLPARRSLPTRCAPICLRERSDAKIWQALQAVEMQGRIEEAGGAWITQDMLSLGEAQGSTSPGPG